jgi:hypothetical protein
MTVAQYTFTNNTENTENRTYITIEQLNIHNNLNIHLKTVAY